MFEKEAEELFKKKPLGYEMKPELEIYTDGFKDGYNKANEWHYVKDGDYPKDESKVLCVISELEDSYCEIGYYSQVETETHRWIFEDYVMKDKSKEEWGVIAWKEIVLPELKES